MIAGVRRVGLVPESNNSSPAWCVWPNNRGCLFGSCSTSVGLPGMSVRQKTSVGCGVDPRIKLCEPCLVRLVRLARQATSGGVYWVCVRHLWEMGHLSGRTWQMPDQTWPACVQTGGVRSASHVVFLVFVCCRVGSFLYFSTLGSSSRSHRQSQCISAMDSSDDEGFALVEVARQEVRLLRLTFESRRYFLTQMCSLRTVRLTVPLFR